MKKKHPNTAVKGIGTGAKRFAGLIARFADDGVTVYAAQATFYIIVASIPFLIILISLSRYIFPETLDTLFNAISNLLPQRFDGIFSTLYKELCAFSGFSVISLTALMALWSSSRAVASVIRGVSFIYDADNSQGFLKNIIYSLVYTIAFVILIIGVLTVLVFGSALKDLLTVKFPRLDWLFDLIIDFRGVFFFVVLTLFFSLIYYAVSKSIIKPSGTLIKYKAQLPGALFAAAGWMLFSYFFSVYLNNYPSASYIYGSLAAVMLLMFWLYFCMVILLAGAEINKLLAK